MEVMKFDRNQSKPNEITAKFTIEDVLFISNLMNKSFNNGDPFTDAQRKMLWQWDNMLSLLRYGAVKDCLSDLERIFGMKKEPPVKVTSHAKKDINPVDVHKYAAFKELHAKPKDETRPEDPYWISRHDMVNIGHLCWFAENVAVTGFGHTRFEVCTYAPWRNAMKLHT